MLKAIKEIKDRYKDIMVDVLDRQMFNDVVMLLHYIDILHELVCRKEGLTNEEDKKINH